MSPYGLTESGERFTARLDDLAERARTRELAGPDLASELATLTDLNHVDLEGVDLDGANLTGLTLLQANLRGASLRNAVLTRAELSGLFTAAGFHDVRIASVYDRRHAGPSAHAPVLGHIASLRGSDLRRTDAG